MTDDLKELLALLYGADPRFGSLRGAYRTWREPYWMAQASEAARDSRTQVLRRKRTDQPQPIETLVWSKGDLFRIERRNNSQLLSIAISTGEQWWTWDEIRGTELSGTDPDERRSIGAGVRPLIEPQEILGDHRLAVTGRTIVAEREAISAIFLPLSRRTASVQGVGPALGRGADRYVAQVDVACGLILEVAAEWKGRVFQRVSSTAMTTNIEIDDSTFEFRH
jgi:outer membrane lipoprotein-sorting protein